MTNFHIRSVVFFSFQMGEFVLVKFGTRNQLAILDLKDYF